MMTSVEGSKGKTIYGDGTNTVKVIGNRVHFTKATDQTVETFEMSIEAFREVTLGWDRYQEESK